MAIVLFFSLFTHIVPAQENGGWTPPEDLESLPPTNQLPSLFTLADGTRVHTVEDWRSRRDQLKGIIQYYAYGTMPGRPVKVTPIDVIEKNDIDGGGVEQRMILRIETEKKPLKLGIALYVPPGQGPHPVMIREEATLVRTPATSMMIERGYMVAVYARHDLAPDNKDEIGSAQQAYPDHDWATLAVWAWGAMRVVDYLETRDDVDSSRIGISGHSRGGKVALLAGALDERFALVNPNGSGAGGAGSFRVNGEKCETLKAISDPDRFGYWFHPRLRWFADRENQLPFDQHFLKALVAPRALLCTDSLDDLWANPSGTQETSVAAHEVFAWLGVPRKTGLHFRRGRHDSTPADWKALLDFADWHFFEKKPSNQRLFWQTPFEGPGRIAQETARHFNKTDGLPSDDVRRVVLTSEDKVLAETATGNSVWNGEAWQNTDTRPQDEMRPPKIDITDALGRRWPIDESTISIVDSLDRLWIGCSAGVARRESDASWTLFEGKDGLPVNTFTSAASGSGGEVWFGTKQGIVCCREGKWSYRQGLRWLPDDDVRSVAVDGEGTLWAATAKGVGRIARRRMSFEEKAAHYEYEIEHYIKRTEFGYLSPVRLGNNGDRSKVTRYSNDNDGLWTSMYGAGQCFAFAATGRPEFRDRATAAFRALAFLQEITQTGEHRPPPGFVARSIQSTELPDPNIGRLEFDRERQRSVESLWKVYEPRWPKSGDGKWYWKSDTSSDELDGHYFFYGTYFDHVASTERERANIRRVVAGLTDHLIGNGFKLIDHDGTPTRWGRFDPEALNHDPVWELERGLNSLSMLAYLAVAYHVTGDAKYEVAARQLREKHAYHTNVLVPKIHRGFGSGNHSDDEMTVMGFYHLIKYTEDPKLKRLYARAFHRYWQLLRRERNPFFHFAFAAVASLEDFATPWDTVSLYPDGDWLVDSTDALRGFPLDRRNWPHRNSHRLDVASLAPEQGAHLDKSNPFGRGYRQVDGKVLPVSERHFNHWNTDPWVLDYGGDGRILGSGTVFLLPYYMGLYHGFVLPSHRN